MSDFPKMPRWLESSIVDDGRGFRTLFVEVGPGGCEGLFCLTCRRKAVIGEVVLKTPVTMTETGNRISSPFLQIICKGCVERLLAAAPAGHTDRDFAAIKRKLQRRKA